MDIMKKTTNDKRLIDANRALEIVRDQRIAHPNAYHLTNYATLILREAPTVDAVEVVRCRECKYRFKNNGHDKSGCPIIDANIWMDDDDFCSHGEREEGTE